MTGDPTKLSQFWQELKRRKVVRVITVYAAAAFVILELTDIVAPSLGLPDWTLNLIIILLCIGFIIAVILSWIYDVHPEGGIVKTDPAHKVKEEISASSNSWKIASFISFIVIVGLIVLNIIPRTGKKEILDKSIAVLPFIDDSPGKNNEHIINGVMEDLLINLQTIKDLRVPGRTSTEKYRNNLKPIPEIAAELNVTYIVEGSGQRYGNKIRLRVQLVEGFTDKHIWADSYDEEIKGPEDIFRIQSQIAESIAAELEAIITPEEKLLIEKIPTTSLIAHEFYNKGRDKHNQYWLDNDNRMALERAEELYIDALKYDSTFAKAYTGLAWAYRDKHFDQTYFLEDFLDSTLALANIALSYDNKLEEAFQIKGNYYLDYGLYDEALSQYDQVLNINPNYWRAYSGRASIYSWMRDFVKLTESFHKVIEINRGSELPHLLRMLGGLFAQLKMYKTSEHYINQAFRIDNDTSNYLEALADSKEMYDFERGKIVFEEERELSENKLQNDSTLIDGLAYKLGYSNSVLGNDEKAYKYWLKYAQRYEKLERQGISVSHRIAYAYWQVGEKEVANKYFKQHLFHCKESIRLNRPYANRAGAYYDLAGYYAFKNEKDSSYYYLDVFLNNLNFFGPIWHKWISYDPMFNNLREEQRFENIIQSMRNKDQEERRSVIAWMRENNKMVYD